jgi:hypothetical protein
MAVSLSALRAGRPLPPQEESWYSFVFEAESTQGKSALERLGKLKKSNELIRTRTRDLPACSIVPQPPTIPLPGTVFNAQLPVNNPVTSLHCFLSSDKFFRRPSNEELRPSHTWRGKLL